MKCARCGRTFIRHSVINANWCASDRVFLCRKCAASSGTSSTCPACRGRTSRAHSSVFIASIVAVIVAATAGGVLLGTDLVDRSYEFSPMTPIAHASPGSTIKIYGVIQGGLGTVVLNGVFVSSGKSSHWSWTNYNFFVLVGNSTVQVNVAQLGNSVYGSPHDLSSDQEQYWVGDSVAVVGTVTSSNGLDAKAVAPTPEGFWAAWEDDAAIIPLVLAGIFVGVLVVVHLLNGRRAIQHNARLASANPFAYQPVLDPPPIAPLP